MSLITGYAQKSHCKWGLYLNVFLSWNKGYKESIHHFGNYEALSGMFITAANAVTDIYPSVGEKKKKKDCAGMSKSKH